MVVVFDVYNDVGKEQTIKIDSQVEGKYFSLHQPHTSATEFVTAISIYPPDDEKTQVQVDRLHTWDDSIKIEVIAAGSLYYILVAES